MIGRGTQGAANIFSVRSKCMRNLKFLWHLFEWASGMKINREKSELYYLGQKAGKGVRLANILECRTGAFPTNYLGLPLSPRTPSKEAWRGIIQKFHHKIGGWQAKLLFRGGRLILVNAVLTNIPLFS
ncbi:hypothetical protein ACMD2_16223 [Ananas comosus]|uniref:Uncharacterized protein n=1 Tax=Ananas comosus TaxID=4615 RepID=A0A199VCS5_ANACO|nr:hypothetical protein ACMD2_16223 [Ananas comosus]